MRKGRTVGAMLAGGRSRRFGSPKGLALLGGRPLVAWVLAAHRAVFDDILLVTNTPEHYASFGVPMAADTFTNSGPLAGVHAALRWAEEIGADGVCCTPSDAPFVSAALLRILERCGGTGAFQAVVPSSGGPLGFEPLFAWYSTGTASRIEAQLTAGETSMKRLIEVLPSVRILCAREVEAAGDASLIFHNVNTQADLETARALLSGRRDGSSGRRPVP
jgi:molybdenum cofactor guanylyltransferase